MGETTVEGRGNFFFQRHECFPIPFHLFAGRTVLQMKAKWGEGCKTKRSSDLNT